jgi:rhodanese-related sulfurtransferase
MRLKLSVALVVILLSMTAAVNAVGTGSAGIVSVTAKQASELIATNRENGDFVVLDIRTPAEFKAGHLPRARMVDYYSPGFSKTIRQLDTTKTYLVYCRSGNRSSRSMRIFKGLKFQTVYHMNRGLIGWNSAGLKLYR